MPSQLSPGSILSLSAQAAERLVRMDSGDAALLYLHLLGHPDGTGLGWSAPRLRAAMELLSAQGLAPALPQAVPAPPAPLPEGPPEYSTRDVTAALKEGPSFRELCDEAERRLGKKLTASDLKSLYTLYDYLALPAEVILMLITWCVEEMERKYGPGRRPFLSQIKKEGFIWAGRGIDTVEAAEAHMQGLQRLRGRAAEVLRLLDIQPRPLVEREKTYIAAWDQMGFDDGAIRMAYEKTVLKKQSMDWSYMNGILRRWHEKGLHTAAAVQTGDRPAQPVRAGGVPDRSRPGEEQRSRQDMERMRRMLEQMKREEG